jgi:hypothetical protein
MTFAVERTDTAGQVLSVETGSARWDNWLGAPSGTVTPRTVARSVRTALAAGWEPARRGSAFRLVLTS